MSLWVDDNTARRAANEKPHVFRVRVDDVVWLSAAGASTREQTVERDVGQPEHRVLVAYVCSDQLPYGAVSTWPCRPDGVGEGGRPDRDLAPQQRHEAREESE